jgi:hypothetical protein
MTRMRERSELRSDEESDDGGEERGFGGDDIE